MLRTIIALVLDAYVAVMIARMVLSWVQAFNPSWTPKGPLLVLANLVYALTDPPLRALGKVFRPADLGGIRLDTAFLALMAIVMVLQWVNAAFVPF